MEGDGPLWLALPQHLVELEQHVQDVLEVVHTLIVVRAVRCHLRNDGAHLLIDKLPMRFAHCNAVRKRQQHICVGDFAQRHQWLLEAGDRATE